MTTVQEVLTDAIPPFPFFIENPVDLNNPDLPANKANNNQFANNDPVVERQKGVPITPLLAHEEVLPDRCQFTFSDGRQCSMARCEVHPSLCRFHYEREEQLFGDPAPGGNVVGRALDLPELYSACRDLTTAAGVNRALAQVFRLLAQRRISRQEAATFGHLAQLLLRSISAARAESTADSSHESPAANVYQSRRNVYQQDELSPHNKAAASASENKQPVIPVVERQKGVFPRESHGDQELSRVTKSTPLLPHDKVAPRAHSSPEATEGRTLSTPEPATAVNSSSQAEIPDAACELQPIPQAPFPASTATAANVMDIRSFAALNKEPFAAPNRAAHNPRRTSTYENAELKAVQNEQLHKSGPTGRAFLSPARGDRI